MLCIFILYISILTHAPPSPPFLTFGARHSHGCGRLYACSPPGGTQCPPFTVLVLVINTYYYYCDRSPSCDWRIDQSNRGEFWAAAGCVELTECGNTWPGRKRVEQGLHAYTCEGADENSWQSRPRHAVLSPTLGRLHPPRTHCRRRSRPSRNASTQRDGSLQRQDGGRHFLLSCSRPAAT